MSITLIQSPSYPIPSKAVRYLQRKSRCPLTIYNGNSFDIIKDQYAKGVRKFILLLLTSDVTILLDLIKSLFDAKFVVPTSGSETLRGILPNLYSTATSIHIWVGLIIDYFQPVISTTCFIYDDGLYPSIMQVTQLFKDAGYSTFPLNDLAWQGYTNLLFLALPQNLAIYSNIAANLISTQFYTMYSLLNAYPPVGFKLPDNVLGLSIVEKLSTGLPQIRSLWNSLVRSPQFSHGHFWFGVLPLLTNQSWRFLEKQSLISNRDQLNGIYFSRYLPRFDIDVSYNTKNCHLPTRKLPTVWLGSREYSNIYTQANLEYLKQIRGVISEFKITRNIPKWVCRYWRQGYRQFVLESPSSEIKAVQRLKLKSGIFICTRATDPTLRHPGSPYLFALADDSTMIQTMISGLENITLRKTTCVMGSSNNINIPLFKAELDSRNIPWINVDNLDTLDPTTIILYSVGNELDYERILNYLEANKPPKLTDFRRYGDYITQEQLARIQKLGLTDDVTLINFNSSQPFLESDYSTISRPTYLSNLTYFYALSNLLYKFSIKFLFEFGYLIDI